MIEWSLRDTAASIRADKRLNEGVPNVAENDTLYFNLVALATRDPEAARKALYQRVLSRKLDQTGGGT